MAEDAKNSAAEEVDAKKGRASGGTVPTEEAIEEAEVMEATDSAVENTEKAEDDEVVEEESSREQISANKKKTNRAKKGEQLESVEDDEPSREEFQEQVREQIENCKNELEISLEQVIERVVERELSASTNKQVKAANRRRRWSAFVHDVIILLLLAVVVYFGWCLYDARYFDWMEPKCDANQSCEQDTSGGDVQLDEPEEVIKDTRWYINNYGYLFEDLQLGLNADSVEAYYLYSGDYKVSDIKPAYLLGMAYNNVMPTATAPLTMNLSVPAADLRTAFDGIFGTTDYFVKTGFTHGCKRFHYERETDSFVTENGDCVMKSEREIVETIDEMYEEGSVLYVLTTAAIYDEREGSFYSFDDLFKPAVTNVKKEDLTAAKNQASLNRYQYQFKKTGEKYHFSGVVKLQ